MIKLKPIYDGRKSFYGKAEYEKANDELILYSYRTPVELIKTKKY